MDEDSIKKLSTGEKTGKKAQKSAKKRVRKGAGRALEWEEDSTSNVRIAKKKP